VVVRGACFGEREAVTKAARIKAQYEYLSREVFFPPTMEFFSS